MHILQNVEMTRASCKIQPQFSAVLTKMCGSSNCPLILQRNDNVINLVLTFLSDM